MCKADCAVYLKDDALNTLITHLSRKEITRKERCDRKAIERKNLDRREKMKREMKGINESSHGKVKNRNIEKIKVKEK